MNKKTLGMLKIAYAKAISIPPVGHALNSYKRSKVVRNQKRYHSKLNKTFQPYEDVCFNNTTFIEHDCPFQPDSEYVTGFDIYGYISDMDEARLSSYFEKLVTISPDDAIQFKVAITENDISPALVSSLISSYGVFVLNKRNNFIISLEDTKVALISVNAENFQEKDNDLLMPAQLLTDIAFAKDNSDYILVYAYNKNFFAKNKVSKALSNLDVDCVIQTDGETIDLGNSTKRIDGNYINTVSGTGELYGNNPLQNGGSVIIRHKLIEVPFECKYYLNKCFIPIYNTSADNCITPVFMDYNTAKESPEMLLAYKYILENQGRYHSICNNLTIQSICEITGSELPSEYSFMKNVSVGRVTNHWFDASYGDVLFFNEPYNDVNDVIEKPLKVRLLIVEKALQHGVIFVFSHVPLDKQIPHIFIKSPMEAHIKLSAAIRAQYPVRTIGITGSIGKTSTKDMLYEVLKEKYDANRNLRNTNTQVNIGQHIQDFKEWNEVYIQEIGGGRRGGASRHSRMIVPEATVVTNIGDAHIGNHGSRKALMINKLGVIDGMQDKGILYLNGDDPLLSKAHPEADVTYFAVHNKSADYYADNLDISDGGMNFDICHGQERVPVHLEVLGEHNVLNAVCCFAIAKQFGLSDKEIQTGLLDFKTSGVRQNLLKIAEYNVFVDCFNASPDSIDSSLSVLDSMKCQGKKIAVIGDVTGAASMAKKIHNNIGEIVKKHNMDELVCYGPNSRIVHEIAKKAGINTLHIKKPKELETYVKNHLTKDDIILFKGSSKMKLAQSIDHIFGTMLSEQMYTDTVKIKYANIDDFTVRICPVFASVEKYTSSKQECTVPAKVKGKSVRNIVDNAFRDNEFITKVCLNRGICYIGKDAFSGCINLTSIELPDSVSYIDSRAFAGCANLKSIKVPSGAYVSPDAFEGCNITIE